MAASKNPKLSRNRKKGSSSSKKSSSSSSGAPRFEVPAIEIPQRSVLQEGRDSIQVMREAYPALAALTEKYGPRLATAEANTAAARGQAELSAIQRLGPDFEQALMAASPRIRQAVDAVGAGLSETGPSDLESELRQQALSELRLGGTLAPDEAAGAEQQARAAYSARGMVGSRPAAIAEVLNRTNLQEMRKGQRRGFASGVEALSQQRRAGDRAFSLGATSTLGGYLDPQQRIFGRGGSVVSSSLQGPAQFQGFLGAAGDVGQSNQQAALTGALAQADHTRFLQGLQWDDYMTRLNAGYASDIAGRNNSSAVTGAAIGAAGTAVAGIAIAF